MKKVMDWLHSEQFSNSFEGQFSSSWQGESKPDVDPEVVHKIVQRSMRHTADKKPMRHARIHAAALRYVAILVFLLVALFALFYFLPHPQADVAQVLFHTVTKENPSGQKSKIFLPDGSVVWLNSESSISYVDDFADGNRLVRLEGEAYFEVVHSDSALFVVEANAVRTLVLGTKFNVYSRPAEGGTTVAIVEGRVRVTKTAGEQVARGESLELTPGEAVAYTAHDAPDKFRFDPNEHTVWKDGILFFNKATLPQVVATLERWYGVTIKISNNDNAVWSYSGEFKNEYLKNVLTAMSFTRPFDYEIRSKDVIITFKN